MFANLLRILTESWKFLVCSSNTFLQISKLPSPAFLLEKRLLIVSAAPDYRLQHKAFNDTHKSAKSRLIVVRHPILRFISGFKDIQLERNHDRDMHELTRYAESLSKRESLSLLGAYSQTVLRNPDERHFHTYIQSCSPCQINYNAIVKTDDFNGTRDYFAKSKLVSPKSKQLFSKAKSSRANESKKVTPTWKSFLAELEFEILEKLLERYRNDFVLFDYKIFKCQFS